MKYEISEYRAIPQKKITLSKKRNFRKQKQMMRVKDVKEHGSRVVFELGE